MNVLLNKLDMVVLRFVLKDKYLRLHPAVYISLELLNSHLFI